MYAAGEQASTTIKPLNTKTLNNPKPYKELDSNTTLKLKPQTIKLRT